MTTELWMLTAAAAVTMTAIMIQAAHLMMAYSPAITMGSRDELALSPLARRMQRTVRNHLEGIVVFTPLVVAVSLHDASIVQGSILWGSSDLSALGAQLFVASRIVHLVTYTTAIAVVRSLSWMVGVAGLAMMAVTLF